MINRQMLEKLIKNNGFDDFRWLPAEDITVALTPRALYQQASTAL